MKNIIVREPKIEEYEEVARVLNSEVHYWNEDVFTEEELGWLGIGKDTVEDLIEGRETHRYLIAEVDGGIAGFLSWYVMQNNVGWISRIATLPAYYGKGIGRRLMSEVEMQAKEMNLRSLAMETQKKAEWAVKFHLANGYKILSQKEVEQVPYKGILNKPIVEGTYIFGKKAEDFCK